MEKSVPKPKKIMKFSLPKKYVTEAIRLMPPIIIIPTFLWNLNLLLDPINVWQNCVLKREDCV